MQVKHFMVGPVGTNCYIVINDKSNEALIIDPGAAAELLWEFIEREGLLVKGILLTHGHFDHAGDALKLADHFGAKIYAHEAEKETLEQPGLNLSGPMMGNPESYRADVYLKDEQELDLAGLHFRCLFTPGHTAGGCCFYFPYEDTVFTGDTLFCESVGRTDFPGGSMSTIVNSIKTKLMVMPEATRVFPGHNEPTTIENERMYNPYL